MKALFPGYFSIGKNEFKPLWDSAIFVLDANILLNFYRYSDQTREEFLKILGLLGDRIWVPHRAAFEFLENRLEVIGQQERAYEDAIKSMNDIEASFKNTRQHPFLSTRMMNQLGTLFTEVRHELQKSQEQISTRITSDPILEKIELLLSGKVGEALADGELKAVCAEGESRYKRKIPPGYKDAGKSDEGDPERRFGDLIIWKQILKKATKAKLPVILLLDDRKEDWWQKFRGKTVGPRPELIKEFSDASGKRLHMYQPDHFLEQASVHLKKEVNTSAVTELRERRRADVLQRRREILLAQRARTMQYRETYESMRRHLSVLELEVASLGKLLAEKHATLAQLIEPTAIAAQKSEIDAMQARLQFFSDKRAEIATRCAELQRYTLDINAPTGLRLRPEDDVDR